MFSQLSNSRHNKFALVLAAGASTRMGTCKASLQWCEGKTLLSYQVEEFLLAGITPIVVLGPHNAERKQDCLPGSKVVINPNPSAGKVSSILTGLKHLPKDFGILAFSAVDQPRPTWIYQTLVQAHESSFGVPITVPTYQGRLGHPLLISKEVLPCLENVREENSGVRQIVQDFYPMIQRVEFDTPNVLMDLNTPESYHIAVLSWMEYTPFQGSGIRR
jgi:molybdenum cofactor cytidylyltransferase